MKNKREQTASIIGGADGPTSIFIAGTDKDSKMSLKNRIRNKRYEMIRKRAESKIRPGAHTIDEVINYAKEKYGITPVNKTERKYVESRKNLKEGIICEYKPELLGELKEMPKVDISDERSAQQFWMFIEERSKRIEEIADEDVPMDFHMYELKEGKGHLEITLDYEWDIFGVSFGGDKKKMKCFEKIAKDLYLFYSVTEEDIVNKTKRYSALVCALSDL